MTSSKSASWEDFVRRAGGADVGSGPRERVFLLPQQPLSQPDAGAALPIKSVRAMPSGAAVPLRVKPDGTVEANWQSAGPQRSGDELLIELDGPHTVAEVALADRGGRARISRSGADRDVGGRARMGSAVEKRLGRRGVPGCGRSAESSGVEISNRPCRREARPDSSVVERLVTSVEYFEPCRARRNARFRSSAISRRPRRSHVASNSFPKRGSPSSRGKKPNAASPTISRGARCSWRVQLREIGGQASLAQDEIGQERHHLGEHAEYTRTST